MKLQHLAIIFVIIILPITIVLSVYTSNQIKTINSQSQYSSYLINATYDSIKAFQLNTINNNYSTIGNSKIRDIEAAINVFYGSLATNMGTNGYTKEDLQGYTPAILFTLYDGYYIYSNYYDTEKSEYTYGLKPFSYYSCRYINGTNDFVVNYTLDNTITIIGKVRNKDTGITEYVTKTGHLINLNTIPSDIGKEALSEKLIVMTDINQAEKTDANGNPVAEEYQYVIYNNQKYYKNRDEYINRYSDDTAKLRHKYFVYSSEYKKDYVNSLDTLAMLENLNNEGFKSDSAQKYYEEAQIFTNWVTKNLGDIEQSNAVNSKGEPIQGEYFATDLGSEKIFNISNNNDPLQTNSVFNEHRMNVIRKSIETNLLASIKTFSEHTVIGYEFGMPKISEDEWYKIVNNISVVSFLQGLPIGGKIFNDYCVVSNDANKECVGNESIYIIAKRVSSGQLEYHKPGCKTLLEGLNTNVESNKLEIVGAYQSADFKRRSISITSSDANAGEQLTGADSGKYAYFYPQQGTACYDCIVTASDTYSTDDIIKGEIQIKDLDGNITQTIKTTNNTGFNQIRTYYLRALARSRYDLYLTNGYFGY